MRGLYLFFLNGILRVENKMFYGLSEIDWKLLSVCAWVLNSIFRIKVFTIARELT